MTLKGHKGKYAENGGVGGMVEASEDDAVVEEGGVEEGGVEEGVVGNVERVGAGKLMAVSPAWCSAEVSVCVGEGSVDADVASAGTGEVSKDGDLSRDSVVGAVGVANRA
jgi:hypothetical protein